MDTVRQITARLEAIETAQRRGRPIEDVSGEETEEVVAGNVAPVLDQGDERCLRTLTRPNARPRSMTKL